VFERALRSSARKSPQFVESLIGNHVLLAKLLVFRPEGLRDSIAEFRVVPFVKESFYESAFPTAHCKKNSGRFGKRIRFELARRNFPNFVRRWYVLLSNDVYDLDDIFDLDAGKRLRSYGRSEYERLVSRGQSEELSVQFWLTPNSHGDAALSIQDQGLL